MGYSLDTMIGQMILAGFNGLEISHCQAIRADIRLGQVGGVIFFDLDVPSGYYERNIRSPEQVQTLISGLQAEAPIPLIVAVDQEGGRVRRLKEKHGFPPLPSAAELGETDDPGITYRLAAQTAASLAKAGFTLNLAPVVDLNLNPDNPIIGRLGRSFSADPDRVCRHARAFIEPHRRLGIGTALKHFPGHGSAASDSHLELPDVTSSWSETELEPFRILIGEGLVDAVMIAHLYHRGLDADAPATLSRAIVTGLLREKLGFRGVVISDDLDMKAIRNHYSLEDAVERAIGAGVDILTLGNNLDSYDAGLPARVFATIQRLVREGAIDSSRIEQSCRRIMDFKHSHG